MRIKLGLCPRVQKVHNDATTGRTCGAVRYCPRGRAERPCCKSWAVRHTKQSSIVRNVAVICVVVYYHSFPINTLFCCILFNSSSPMDNPARNEKTPRQRRANASACQTKMPHMHCISAKSARGFRSSQRVVLLSSHCGRFQAELLPVLGRSSNAPALRRWIGIDKAKLGKSSEI
jgi:hypothetical protein